MRRRSATDAARASRRSTRSVSIALEADDRAQGVERASRRARTSAAGVTAAMPAADRLERVRAARRGRGPGRATLPSAVASTGPATTGQPGGVGGELAQQLVLRAAADDVDDVDRRGRRASAAWRTVRA